MQVGATAIEQSQERGVDMPDCVGLGCANADSGLSGMQAFAWSPPVEAPDQPIPGGPRSEDSAEPLRQQGQSPGGDMAVLFGGDHLLESGEFRWRELLGCRTWTVGYFCRGTKPSAFPGMVAGMGEADDP